PLHALLVFGGPWHGSRRDIGALVDYRRERAAAGLCARLTAAVVAGLGGVAFEGVGARVGHHRAHVLERSRRGHAAAHLDAEASNHLRLEPVGEHRDTESAFRTAARDGPRPRPGPLWPIELHPSCPFET